MKKYKCQSLRSPHPSEHLKPFGFSHVSRYHAHHLQANHLHLTDTTLHHLHTKIAAFVRTKQVQEVRKFGPIVLTLLIVLRFLLVLLLFLVFLIIFTIFQYFTRISTQLAKWILQYLSFFLIFSKISLECRLSQLSGFCANFDLAS